jgi:hypothetical protein
MAYLVIKDRSTLLKTLQKIAKQLLLFPVLTQCKKTNPSYNMNYFFRKRSEFLRLKREYLLWGKKDVRLGFKGPRGKDYIMIFDHDLMETYFW